MSLSVPALMSLTSESSETGSCCHAHGDTAIMVNHTGPGKLKITVKTNQRVDNIKNNSALLILCIFIYLCIYIYKEIPPFRSQVFTKQKQKK